MRRFGAATFLVLLLGTNCGMCPPDNGTPDAGPTGGAGTIRIGGATKPYSIVPDETKLLILVKKIPGLAGICDRMHNHVVRSTATQFTFALDKDTPDNSTLEATVYTAGLIADRQADRDEFDLTRGDTSTAGNEAAIEQSTRGHLKAEEHSEIVFRAHNSTSLDGMGSSPVDVTMKGTNSSFNLTGTSTWDGERLTIEATGTINGASHTIPEPSENFADCVGSEMDVKMKLVFAPGASDGGVDIPDASGFTPREFPDDGTCATTAFQDVQPILVRRCAGCHSDPPSGLVATPLATFANFRVSTGLEPDVPLYEQALERIQRGQFDDGVMPPLGDGVAVPPSEVAIVQAWVQSGAHLNKCDADGGMVTPPDAGQALDLPAPACGTITFEQLTTTLTAHACLSCHTLEGPGRPSFTTSARGMDPVNHNYYRPFNIWEASALRMKDGTMPPYAHTTPQADYELVWRYAQQQKMCP